MAVAFKKMLRKNPGNRTLPGKYYPQLLVTGKNATLDDIAYKMKEKSSLTYGDIRSVIVNFVEAMREALYNGQSVNIADFGVFSLSAKSEGVEDVEKCTASKIQSVRIRFRSSTNVKPDVNSTRAGERIDFYDIETYLNKESATGGEDGGGSGGSGGDGGGGEDPTA